MPGTGTQAAWSQDMLTKAPIHVPRKVSLRVRHDSEDLGMNFGANRHGLEHSEHLRRTREHSEYLRTTASFHILGTSKTFWRQSMAVQGAALGRQASQKHG